MISIRYKGDLSKTHKFLTHALKADYKAILDKYGRRGVDALREATPVRTGKTANSWYYTIEKKYNSIILSWSNSNINDGVPIAVILQYGHGTGSGGYVEGIDYINPAMKPLFERIADDLFEEVTRA